MGKTADYYKKNPKAAAKRRTQQSKYNKTSRVVKLEVMQTNLIGNLVPMEMVMGKTLLTIRGVRPKEDFKAHLSTEEADLKLKNDPITT